MNSTKQQIMAELTASIQKKWGVQAVRTGNEVGSAASFSPLPTGWVKLDTLLGGGILRGQITELCGVQTSGVATLALKTIASAQKLEERVIYTDTVSAFNPKYAADCRVNLHDLILVRPATPTEGIEIATDIVSRFSAGLLVFGHAAGMKDTDGGALRRLVNAVRRSSGAFVVLNRATTPSTSPFHAYAATRLHLQRLRWLQRWGIVGGYLVRVSVVKLNGSDCNRSVTLRFDLP